MTAVENGTDTRPRDEPEVDTPRTMRRPDRAAVIAIGTTLTSVVAFLVIAPPVGDLWAARSREYAAAHDVGLRYWFAWFDGTVPGHYSVIEPYLAVVVGSAVLAAIAAVAIVAQLHLLVPATGHRDLALYVGTLAVACCLWSGRVPFLLGAAVSMAVLLLVRARKPVPAAVATLLANLVTPVCGAFLIIGLVGVVVFDRARRTAALAVMAVSAACLLGVALYFGSPGPEGYHLLDLSTTLSATVSLFVLRPSRATRLVLATSIVACLAVAAVPNGLGANYERLVWFCLPVGCLITARVRRSVAVLAVTLPLVLGLLVTLRDLHVAAQPMSDASYYDALNRELATVPGLQDHRVEVTPDGTHTAAYALLGHAQLARGYETQSDHALNNVLFGSDLNAASYRRWLDENAVGYVVHSRLALDNLPEWVLVNRHLPGYLHEVWHDADLTLYSVDKPVPIVPVPGRVVRVTQSRFTFTLPSATPQQGVVVRLRWSRFLRLTGASDGARLSPAPGGWLTVVTNGPCTCTLSS